MRRTRTGERVAERPVLQFEFVRTHVESGFVLAVDDVCRAQEAHCERRLRRGVQLLRRSGLRDAAVFEQDDVVGQLHRFVGIVRDEDRRDVRAFVQIAQPRAQVAPDVQIERGERLVEQQDRWFRGQRPGQGDALALTAREFARQARFVAVQPHEREQFLDARGRAAARPVAHVEGKADVRADGHVRKERIILRHEADAAAARRNVRDVLSFDADCAAVGMIEARDDAQQRRFAAARGAQQRGKRVPFDRRADVFERAHRAIRFGDVFENDAHAATAASR